MSRLYAYFTDSAFVDVTLWCLGRSFKAHRILLSACSDYFERVLLEQSRSGGGARPVSVVLHCVEPVDLAGLLELMYRGRARVAAHHLPRFLEAARLLGVRLLRSAALRVRPDDDHQQAESSGQDTHCLTRRLGCGGTPTPQSPEGVVPRRAQQPDVTAPPVPADPTEKACSGCQGWAAEAAARGQRGRGDQRLQGAGDGDGGLSDCEAVVPASHTSAAHNHWQLQQELPTAFKHLDEKLQAPIKKLEWGSPHAAVRNSTELPEQPTDNTQNSVTHPKVESIESAGNETHSSKQLLKDADTLPVQPSWGKQGTRQCDAAGPHVGPTRSDAARTDCTAAVPATHQRTPRQWDVALPEPPLPPAPPGDLLTGPQSAVTPATLTDGSSAASASAGAQLSKAHAPLTTSNAPVQGGEPQTAGSASTSLRSSAAQRADRPVALTKMAPVPCPSVVCLATSQATPEEPPHSDNRQSKQNVKGEKQLGRGESENDSNNDQQSAEEQEVNRRRGRVTCTECGKTFASPYSLKKHMRTHTGDRRYLCALCGKLFSQERNFRYHMSLHSGTREFAASCPECGKTFSNRNYLSSHLKIHRNRREYACAECGRRFNQRVAFSMHARTHSGYRPHRCALCGKAFSRKVLLTQHMRTHTGEKPFSCQVCDKQFSDRSNMLVHARSHLGIKPYTCDLCGRAFSQRSNLRSHMVVHMPRLESPAGQTSASATPQEPTTPQHQELRTTSVIFKSAVDALNTPASTDDSGDVT